MLSFLAGQLFPLAHKASIQTQGRELIREASAPSYPHQSVNTYKK